MPDDRRAEIARLARAFVEQRAELGDTELWPAPTRRSALQEKGPVTPAPSPSAAETDREPPSTGASPPAQRPPTESRRDHPPQQSAPPVDDTPIAGSVRNGVQREEEPAQETSQMTPEDIGPDAWEGLTLEQFGETISPCERCSLCAEANNFVFGKGDPNADIMFIGEGPGEEENRQGLPFVGRAGQLLDKMIVAMQLRVEDVYITNVVKHRPPRNRNPQADEIDACMPYLQHQIALIQPKLICLLGRVSAQAMLNSSEGLGRMRGRWHEYAGIKTMVTYHPAALLRNPNWKPHAWDDLKALRLELDGTQL